MENFVEMQNGKWSLKLAYTQNIKTTLNENQYQNMLGKIFKFLQKNRYGEIREILLETSRKAIFNGIMQEKKE